MVEDVLEHITAIAVEGVAQNVPGGGVVQAAFSRLVGDPNADFQRARFEALEDE